jgi:glutamate synthase (NADPH/NADH) large chain
MTGGIVTVLGPTGRNFAAGMSGGIAYVLDEAGDFESRCNLAMVELEPIADEDDVLEATEHQGGDLETHGKVDISRDMTRYDAQRLRGVIQKHLDATGSAVAQRILDNWAEYLPKFVKVMPVDYRRALEEMQAQQAAEKSAA